MADFGRTAEGRKVSDWPKIFGLKTIKLMKHRRLNPGFSKTDIFKNGNLWVLCDNLDMSYCLSSGYMRYFITIRLRFLSKNTDILKMSILSIAAKTFDTT